MKKLIFNLLGVKAFDQTGHIKFLNLAQTSDNKNTKNEEIDEFNACNYQTGNNTLYHLKDINTADGGSGTQQLVV